MATTLITTSFPPDEFESLISGWVIQAVRNEIKALAIPADQNLILTRQETAKLLTISLPTLHDYTKRGLIKSYRIGCKVRYKRDDIEAALKQIKTCIK